MSDGPLPGGKYEFTERHNWAFEHLARYVRIVATFMMVLGVLSGAGGVLALVGVGGREGAARWFAGVSGLASGGLWITMAAFLLGAADGFRAVVETTGRDIKNLMIAIEQLGKAFVVQAVGFCLQLILVGVGLIVARTH